MVAARNDRNFHVVYVGGPMNGFIDSGQTAMLTLTKTPDGKILGQKIRLGMPRYLMPHNNPTGSMEEAMRMHELAGIEPFGSPVYVLEETTDPNIYRYRFIGEYDPARDDAPPAP